MDERQPLLAPPLPSQSDVEDFADLTHVPSVSFNPEGDKDNPLNWPKSYKWSVVALLAFMAFTTTFACIGPVPIAPNIIYDLKGENDKSASVLMVTIWELGEAMGPLVIAPLSEVYGRYPAYNGANILFIFGTIVVAITGSADLLIFGRFLTGCAVASNVLGPSVLGDILPPEQRGSALSIIYLANLTGGAIGPAIGGALSEAFGWRAVIWAAVAIAIPCEIMFLCFFRETYSVSILQRRASLIVTDPEDANKLVRTATGTEIGSGGNAVWQAVKRPARVFFGSFVLQIMSLFGCVGFTFFYILSTNLAFVLRDRYHFSESSTGIAFISFSVGSTFGILLCNFGVDRIYIALKNKNSGRAEPEFRLPIMIFSSIMLPIGVMLYGWNAELVWPAPLLLFFVGFVGFALLSASVPLMSYVVDAFGIYSASATTAVLIARCLMGTFLPLATGPLVERLGYGWGFTVLAAICVVVIPIPLLVMKYGTKWRQLSSFSKTT